MAVSGVGVGTRVEVGTGVGASVGATVGIAVGACVGAVGVGDSDEHAPIANARRTARGTIKDAKLSNGHYDSCEDARSQSE